MGFFLRELLRFFMCLCISSPLESIIGVSFRVTPGLRDLVREDFGDSVKAEFDMSLST